MTALTDDQLRQVAAHIVLADARLAADDLSCISDQLDGALADLGITLDGKPEDVDDATLEAIADLIATATITVAWPDTKPQVITWDWREQLPLDYLREALANGLTHLHEVDTGSDEFAIVLSATPLDPDAVQAAYAARHGGDA